ncbi:MAG: GxxExxY protein [Prevotella sp.]|nr:GxxExxY protein [Prevotella sp.]MDY3853333.1 GxxExxY protein [Prevotella sp.]
MKENEISYQIIGAVYEVYKKLGAGLLEGVYEEILKYELEKRGLKVDTQVQIPVVYDGLSFGNGFRADMIVEDKVIVELKSVNVLQDIHFKQLLTYLKLSNLHLGLLINFNSNNIHDGIRRVVNNL